MKNIKTSTKLLLVLTVPAGAVLCLALAGLAADGPTAKQADARQRADRMVQASRTTLAPVYAPLARQIVKDFDLAETRGVGIDVGGGPGTLIVELCKHTKLHWINADINPYCFSHFLRLAEVKGAAGRVSAVFADARDLPFKDNYADVVISRGSYHFWGDRKKGFQEILRVLKPGGLAYIGRGLPRDMPLETARSIRAKQGKSIKYDLDKEAAALLQIMADLGIKNSRVQVTKAPGGADVNYGLWVEFHKPKGEEH